MPGPGEPDDGGVVPGHLFGQQTLLARLVKRAARRGGLCHTTADGLRGHRADHGAGALRPGGAPEQPRRSSAASSASPRSCGPRRQAQVHRGLLPRLVDARNRARRGSGPRAGPAEQPIPRSARRREGPRRRPVFSAAIQASLTLSTWARSPSMEELPRRRVPRRRHGSTPRPAERDNDLTLGPRADPGRGVDLLSARYQPEKAPDGRWRKLRSRSRRRKIEGVRAARGLLRLSACHGGAAVAGRRLRGLRRHSAAEARSPPVLLLGPVPGSGEAPAPDPILATILEKAGGHVVELREAFRDVVVEETLPAMDDERRCTTAFESRPGLRQRPRGDLLDLLSVTSSR